MNLLRLPAKSLTETLRCMRVIDLISLSFTSKASKKAVESINLNIGYLNVRLNEKTLTVELKDTYSGFKLDLIFDNVETMPHFVRIYKEVYYTRTAGNSIASSVSSDSSDGYAPTVPAWSPSSVNSGVDLMPWNPINNKYLIAFKISALKFTARDYLRHLMDVLNRSSIEIHAYKTVHGVSEKCVRALFKDIPIKKIASISEESLNNVLKFTYLQADNLTISGDTRSPCTRHVLCSQFNYLKVFMHFDKLDDLLNLNIRLIDLDSSRFTEKDLNLYLKHWTLGLAHQNLKRLRVSRGDFTRNILNGIPYQKQSTSVLRSFGSGTYWGGYDIQRNDETDATLYISETRSDFNLILNVWE